MSGTESKPKTTSAIDAVSKTLSVLNIQSNKESSSSKDKSDDQELFYFSVEKLTEQELKKVKKKKVEVNGEMLALIAHDNKVYAIQEKCPHYGGPLHQGDIEDLPQEGPCIRCPWHSWKFSLLTGKCVSPQRDDRCVKIYPVKVEKDTVKIGFEKIADSIFSTPP